MPKLDPALTSLREWHCAYKSLAPIHSSGSLQILEIASFSDTTFDLFRPLTQLRLLRVLHLHMPSVTDLGPLGAGSPTLTPRS